MFRILKILSEIWALIMAILGGLVVFMLFTKNSQVSMPKDWSQTLEQFFAPALQTIHTYMGVQYGDFQGYHVDLAYSYLATLLIFMFIFLLFLSAVFNSLDQSTHNALQSLADRRKQYKAKKQAQQQQVADRKEIAAREAGALMALETLHVENSPGLQADLKQQLAELPQQRHIFTQENKALLWFESSYKAALFAQRLAKQFVSYRVTLNAPTINPPTFKMAIHSMETEKSLFKEENFMWALLRCIAANMMVVSQETRVQLDLLHQEDKLRPDQLKTVPFGIFSDLAGRPAVNLYRLLEEGQQDLGVDD